VHRSQTLPFPISAIALHVSKAGARERAVLPFGVAVIDSHLPGGGAALGALHEVAGGNGAIDGAAASLFAAGIAARTQGKVLWCVTRQDLFAPAIAQVGLDPDRVMYVEAGDDKSLLACFEEGRPLGPEGGKAKFMRASSIVSVRCAGRAASMTSANSWCR
jgi:protein ImuA